MLHGFLLEHIKHALGDDDRYMRPQVMDERQIRAAVYKQSFNDAKAVRGPIPAPLIDRNLPEHRQTNIKLGVVFTVVSVIRGFWFRHLFNHLHVKRTL